MHGSHRARRIGAILVAALLAAAAEGRAAELAWEGSLHVELGNLQPIAFHGTGVATLDLGGPGAELSRLRLAGGISGNAAVPVTDPDVTATFHSIRISPALGTGTLSPLWPIAPWPDPQLVRAALPLRGSVRLCLFVPQCSTAVTLPLATDADARAVGVGGVLTAGGFGPVRVSVVGNPWTLFTATWPVATASGGTSVWQRTGFLHGPSSFSSAVAQTGGVIQLVSPVEIRDQAGAALPGFSTLTIRFVPEPGGAWLLAAGALGLIALGRRVPPPPRHPQRHP